MNDMLLNELELLQVEYRRLLSYAIEQLREENTSVILDEINVFWQKNSRLVECALKYIAEPFRSYMCTGASVFGVAENEHYPFLCIGDFHIWDDPICSYIKTMQMSPNKEYNAQMKEQIEETIEDNIRLIDTLKGIVFILPIRLLYSSSTGFVQEQALRAFLALFEDVESIKDYKNRFTTIEEIIPALKENVEHLIVFESGYDSNADIMDRFLHYKYNNSLPLSKDAPDADVFFLAVFGQFSQVIDILVLCMQYQLVPYIRSPVGFQYMLLYAGNFRDHPVITNMLFQCVIAHGLYCSFDTEMYAQIPIEDMCAALRSGKFEESIFRLLEESNIALESPNPGKVSEIINQELFRCLAGHVKK